MPEGTPTTKPAPVLGLPRFLDVRQVAQYLNLNEKKVYALVSEGRIPGTKVTGKWMFPRDLIDRWMMESSHGGLLSDRLIMAGGDDPLLHRVVRNLTRDAGARALVSYTATGTRLGLELLQAHRADACPMHWGPSEESHLRHPALLGQYGGHRRWVLIRAFRREQGVLLRPELANGGVDLGRLLRRPLRWAMRQEGAGARRFFDETLTRYGSEVRTLNAQVTALSERDAAAALVLGLADAAPGGRAAAAEMGLGFVSIGWESFDLALERGIYFRKLFQALIARLRDPETAQLARLLGGYDLAEAGRLVWGQD
jgi:putative molybdopterin biosynthesis protein